MREAGNANNVRIPRFEDGTSKGVGYVNFESEEEVESAIRMFNGVEFKGETLFAEKFVRRSQPPEGGYSGGGGFPATGGYAAGGERPRESVRTMFERFGKTEGRIVLAKGFATEASLQEMRDALATFGHVVFSRYRRFQAGSTCLFMFASQEDAQKAVNATGFTSEQGQVITVEPFEFGSRFQSQNNEGDYQPREGL